MLLIIKYLISHFFPIVQIAASIEYSTRLNFLGDRIRAKKDIREKLPLTFEWMLHFMFFLVRFRLFFSSIDKLKSPKMTQPILIIFLKHGIQIPNFGCFALFLFEWEQWFGDTLAFV